MWQVIQLKQWNVLEKKDDTYIGFETQLCDKQNQDLRR